LFGIDKALADHLALKGPRHGPMFDDCERTADLIIGERKIRALFGAIHELRLRCGQEDDLTTDPQYFIAINTLKDRRVAAVLIRRNHELEACIFFYEHCKFGIGLGSLRGGEHMGESLVAGPEAWRKPHREGFLR